MTGIIERNEAEGVDMERELETLVDMYDVRLVLEALAQVCDEKCDHIAKNWQDYTTAKVWGETARLIEKLADRIDV